MFIKLSIPRNQEYVVFILTNKNVERYSRIFTNNIHFLKVNLSLNVNNHFYLEK